MQDTGALRDRQKCWRRRCESLATTGQSVSPKYPRLPHVVVRRVVPDGAHVGSRGGCVLSAPLRPWKAAAPLPKKRLESSLLNLLARRLLAGC